MDKSIEQFILVAPVLLFSMVAHECAHGYAALKQGDTTAYALGRLTWNPIPHIDLFMTILLPLLTYFTTGIAFGGANPHGLARYARIDGRPELLLLPSYVAEAWQLVAEQP